MRNRPYVAFLAMALAISFLVGVGSDVAARVGIAQESFVYAISQHFYYATAFPLSTFEKAAPFLVLGLISAAFAKRKGFDRSVVVFVVCAVLLSILYFATYQESRNYMQRHMWTASALTVGFLPYKSIPVLLGCVILGFFIPKQRGGANA